jgi:hypothetical protein
MYDVQQIYLTWGGSLGSVGTNVGKEIWQCGVRFAALGGVGTPIGGFGAFDLGDVANAIATYHADPTLHLANDTRLSWVKAALLRVDGEYATEPRLHTFPSGVQGGGGSNSLQAFQVSLAVTLWSGETLGKANYGRFYLPAMNITRTYGSGTLTSFYTDQIATATRTMLQAVDGELSTLNYDWRLAIMSSLGNGTHKPVAQIKVGDVLDTQRRRRNALDETYAVLPYTQQGP